MSAASCRSLRWLCWLLLATTCLVAVAQDGDDQVCDANGDNCGPNIPESVKHNTIDSIAEDGIAEDIHKSCPLSRSSIRDTFRHFLTWAGKQMWFHQFVGLWPKDISGDAWADDYVRLCYLVINRLLLGLYMTRDASYVKVPTAQATDELVDLIRVENIHAPHWDVDGTPNFFSFEWILPKFIIEYFYTPSVTCFYSTLRRLSTDSGELNGTFVDDLDDPTVNTWEVVLKDMPGTSKVDWVMKFYDIAHTLDGNSLWPSQMTDFQQFYKEDEWEDRLEQAMCFGLIGTHRVETGSFSFDNLPGLDSMTFPYRVSLNMFSSFTVRAHFGKYGADMYFDQDGLPTLIVTPSGENIMRGDKTWQYWKFVWRSTFITGITLVDHLHITHFRTANLMARATREALEPDFPMRRLTSIFTFGSIFVNLQAMHTLVGPNHMLHRATPFQEFVKLSNVVPSADSHLVADIPDIPAIKILMNETEFEKLPPLMKSSPFYADGILLVRILKKMVQSVFQSTWEKGVCTDDGQYTPSLLKMRKTIAQETLEAHYAINGDIRRLLEFKEAQDCQNDDFRTVMEVRLVSYFFVVTGWHKHVGFVGDYYKDPELATMSWREGERWGRPRQHIIMTIINVFTSTKQPLLREDYTHLFEGMVPDLGNQYKAIWREFQADLEKLGKTVDERNAKRELVNWNMHPSVLESAVSK